MRQLQNVSALHGPHASPHIFCTQKHVLVDWIHSPWRRFHEVEPQADLEPLPQPELSKMVVTRAKRTVPYPIPGREHAGVLPSADMKTQRVVLSGRRAKLSNKTYQTALCIIRCCVTAARRASCVQHVGSHTSCFHASCHLELRAGVERQHGADGG